MVIGVRDGETPNKITLERKFFDMKQQLRYIPIEGKFMDKKVNDILYGYLQTISFINENKERFVINDDFENQIHIVRDLMDISTNKTVKNQLKNLIKLGLVVEGTTKDKKGNEIKCLYLPMIDGDLFKLIPLETLKFLISTKNKFGVKVYVYLLNKFQWKQKNNETYEFSKKELLKLVGWKGTNQMEWDIMNNILLDLKNNGLINYFESYKTVNGIKQPYLGLTYVGTEVRGMKEMMENKIDEVQQERTEIGVSSTVRSSVDGNGGFKF